MTSVGICASVVSGLRFWFVIDSSKFQKIGVWLSLVVGVATKAAGAGLLTNRPTDSLCKAIVGLPETRYFFVVASGSFIEPSNCKGR